MPKTDANPPSAEGPAKPRSAAVNKRPGRPKLQLVALAAPEPIPEAAACAESSVEGVYRLMRLWEREILHQLAPFPSGDWEAIQALAGQRLEKHWRFLCGKAPDKSGKRCEAPKGYVLATIRGCALEHCERARSRLRILDQVRRAWRRSQAPSCDVLDLRRALARLAPEHCQLVLRVLYDGASVREAAEELGLAEHIARARLKVATEQLRRFLGD